MVQAHLWWSAPMVGASFRIPLGTPVSVLAARAAISHVAKPPVRRRRSGHGHENWSETRDRRAGAGLVPESLARPIEHGRVEEVSATQHPRTAGRGPGGVIGWALRVVIEPHPVARPLAHIPQHVVETVRVRALLADWVRPRAVPEHVRLV